ncbi:MAG: hypothetical protein ABSA59_24580 [Terriglobia bacterium]|jgi:hypothetical protein
MGSLSAIDLLDRLSFFGCQVRVEGDKLKVRGPDRPEVEELVSELRREREAAIAFLRDRESKPPSLEEVRSSLPPCVKLVSYEPKQAPFAVAPVSVVTNAGKFYRAYLADLSRRLAKPEGYHCPPLRDILAKLADAGLELGVDGIVSRPTPSPNGANGKGGER